MRRLLLAALTLALPGSAGAGDFTGAYAGVNAGYGFDTGVDRRTDRSPFAPSRPTIVDGADAGLPPSAAITAGSSKRPQANGGSTKR